MYHTIQVLIPLNKKKKKNTDQHIQTLFQCMSGRPGSKLEVIFIILFTPKLRE